MKMEKENCKNTLCLSGQAAFAHEKMRKPRFLSQWVVVVHIHQFFLEEAKGILKALF